MANKKAQKTTKKGNAKKENGLFSIYGARLSQSGERVNIAIVRGEDDEREWATISLKIKGGKTKVKLNDETVVLAIPRLDIEDEEDDEDDEDEELPF